MSFYGTMEYANYIVLKEITIMKTKTFTRKLILRKETIADLGRDQMFKLHGGLDVDPIEDSRYRVTACIGEYTCVGSYCPIYTCTCTCNIECPPPIDPVEPKPVGIV
jgi:hypothetical protein